MAKKILTKDSENAYSFLSDTLQNLENEDFRNSQIYALIYLKNLKIIKDAINSALYIHSYAEKYMNALPRFEAGYLKILYYEELWASSDWIYSTLNQIAGHGMIDEISFKHVNNFIEALLLDNNIVKYKTEIARIIRGNVVPKTLFALYNNMRIRTDNFSILNEGFYNPFDDELLQNSHENSIENLRNSIQQKQEERIIKKIRVYNAKNRASGVRYEDGKVIATQEFYCGDIIENAPVRILKDEDLYSPNVRDLVFMIDSSKRLFGIPYGIASIARDESETNLSANIDYEFDPEKGNIICIRAIKKIRPNDELIFVNDDFIKENSPYKPEQVMPNDFHNIKVDTRIHKNDPCHGGMAYPSLT